MDLFSLKTGLNQSKGYGCTCICSDFSLDLLSFLNRVCDDFQSQLLNLKENEIFKMTEKFLNQ